MGIMRLAGGRLTATMIGPFTMRVASPADAPAALAARLDAVGDPRFVAAISLSTETKGIGRLRLRFSVPAGNAAAMFVVRALDIELASPAQGDDADVHFELDLWGPVLIYVVEYDIGFDFDGFVGELSGGVSPTGWAESQLSDAVVIHLFEPTVSGGGTDGSRVVELDGEAFDEARVVELDAEAFDEARAVEPATELAHIQAEMPTEIAVDVAVAVVFRLSATELPVHDDLAHDEGVIPVDPALPITVTLFRRNLVVPEGSPESFTIGFPTSGEVVEREFRVIGVRPGLGEVSIVVRQTEDLPLATLRLTTTIVADDVHDAPIVGVDAPVPSPDPSLIGLRSITVDENLADDRSTLLIRVALGNGERSSCIKTLSNKPRFVRSVYDNIGGIRDQLREEADIDARRDLSLRRLQRIGVSLLEYLFDEATRRLLWEHRDDLGRLTVLTSGELDIPWEIVHLCEPGKPVGSEPRFLAQSGLVRWVYDTAHPEEIVVDGGGARFLCPVYEDEDLRLPQTEIEGDILADLFAASAVDPGDATGIAAMVSSRAFDLLHFAGHGLASDEDPPVQQLLLADYRPQANPERMSAGNYTVSDLRRDLPEQPAGSVSIGPIVFLNACDVGRLPSRHGGMGSFAEAFLRGGASAFIGCSWAVGDEPASEFVREFYGALLDGQTISEATSAARLAVRRGGDTSWLAYAVYAHPAARLRRAVPKSSLDSIPVLTP